MIKKFTLAAALISALSVSSAWADNTKMHVWKNGSNTTYQVADVDSVTFTITKTGDKTAMPSDAKTLAAKMYTGINIGNTLESTDNGGNWCADGETCWGASKVTADLIKAYKAAGFNTIRIPVAWHAQESNTSTFEIKSAWMARVKEVVDYVVNEGLYAIINIHWDNGWLETNCTTDKQEAVNKEQAALWKQIATTFKDYDEHLLFASANEPAIDSQEQANVLKSYHQTFINTVRATGGNNGMRNLIIQGPSTDIDKSIKYDVMPIDVVENRLMFEVHFYPYPYALMTEDADWGSMLYFWGNISEFSNIYLDNKLRSVGADGWCNESYVDKEFAIMKTNFVDKGYPVIMGEYAVTDRNLTSYGNNSEGTSYQDIFERSRSYYYEYVNRAAKNNGIVPILWDTPGSLFNRSSDSSNDNSVLHPKALEGIMKGAKEGKYPF